MLVDSHCHLDFEVFKEDFAAVLENARSKNVQCLQTICTKISQFSKIKEIIEAYPFIYGSVGNHPCEVDNEKLLSCEEIVAYASHPKIIGIGETGLDYYHDKGDREKQRESFINHIKAARITSLPVIIHTRDAEEDTLAILASQMEEQPFKALIHCFTASEKFAQRCLELGIYISISGIITFKNAVDIRNTVKNIPLDKLLIETDSPYLAPVPHRGKRNEPAFVENVAMLIADLKGDTFENVAKVTTNNFYTLFSKARI